uniref:CCHC-type domain-containing protein n=1 Tax=Trichogramma kaykai TaxID=54128 RepID=A0ABD2VU84_9HYME
MSAPSGNTSSKQNPSGNKKNAGAKSNANANASAKAGTSATSSADNKPSASVHAPTAQQTASPQSGGAADGFIGACYGCGQTGHRASRCPRTKCYRCHDFGHRARECSMPPPAAAPSTEKCQFCGMENATFLTCPRCVAVRQAMGNFHAEAQRSQAPPQSQNQQR